MEDGSLRLLSMDFDLRSVTARSTFRPPLNFKTQVSPVTLPSAVALAGFTGIALPLVLDSPESRIDSCHLGHTSRYGSSGLEENRPPVPPMEAIHVHLSRRTTP